MTQKKQNNQTAINYLKSRNVEYLVHFTPIDNLELIMKHGILPRDQQKTKGVWTDSLRLDGHTDCSSLSVTYPNYCMLFQKRRRMGMNRFAVLMIDVEALAELPDSDVAYFPTNAAEAGHSGFFSDNVGLNALKGMFADYVPSRKQSVERAHQHLTDEFATSPQAEILVRGQIPSKYIKKVFVTDDIAKWRITSEFGNKLTVINNPKMFWPTNLAIWGGYEDERRSRYCG